MGLYLEMGPPPGTGLGPADRKMDGKEELSVGVCGRNRHISLKQHGMVSASHEKKQGNTLIPLTIPFLN